MTVTVNINGLTLCHTGSGGIARSTLPDVCWTPPGIPVSYINIAESTDLAKGTTTVTADGGHMCAVLGSEISRSTGDEAGTMGGVISGVNMGKATWITFSPNVKLEGSGACRLTDKMLMNQANTACLSGLFQLDLVTNDGMLYVYCQIYCETWETWKDKKAPNEKFTAKAHELARDKYDNALRAATRKAMGEGAEFMFEKTMYAALKKGVLGATKRVARSAEFMKRRLRNTLLSSAAGKVATKAGLKIGLKFVPVVNVISTIYDAYEITTMTIDILDQIDAMMKDYDVYTIRPDVTVVDADGNMKLYDYKYPGDSFGPNEEQLKLYESAGGEPPTEVSHKTCNNCKKK